MNKCKIGLIIFIMSLTFLTIYCRPATVIHSTGDALILGDSFLNVGIWLGSCWLCVKIMGYKQDKQQDDKKTEVE